MSDFQPSWIGRTIGDRYRIDSLLGRGGMSSVYKAFDPNLQRTVAVKLIHPHLSEHPEFVKRFEQEAAAVARLRHPNIIQVYDFNQHKGFYYIVFEHVPGETLEKRLETLKEADLRLPLEDAIRILVALCDAVAYAHEHNMIHRDVKPSNVIINLLGKPVLMDFGIAKMVHGGHVHTATGATVGTACYMSPEQVIGESIDHRADIYSLGVMLYEMTGGKPPFEGNSALTIMMKHVNEPVPDIRLINSNIPDILTGILEKALAKRREDRFSSALEMAAALRVVSQQLVSTSSTQSYVTAPTTPPAGTPVATGEQSPVARAESVITPQPEAQEAQPPVSNQQSVISGQQPAAGESQAAVHEPQSAAKAPPVGKRFSLAWVVGAVVLAIAIGAGAFFLMPRPEPPLPVSAGMVFIPAGAYTVGSGSGDSHYARSQQVTLEAFWIDRYEVTNAQYAGYLAAARDLAPTSWAGDAPPAGREAHPAEGVTFAQAQAYCRWTGKRLPSEAEWEVAARGPQGWLYPWGNEATGVQLPHGGAYASGTAALNRSAFGVYDMAGNVWEWVDEPYAPVADGQRVLRGGAYDFQKDMAFRLPGNPEVPTMYATAGFRCAASDVEIVAEADVVLHDDFTDPGSGWPEAAEGASLSGYHPPDYYHVQAGEPYHLTTAFFGRTFDDVSLEASVFVDSTDTEAGDFRYGLAVRRSGDNYYAFAVSPRMDTWYVVKHGPGGLEVLAEGATEPLQDQTADVLHVDARGSSFAFFVNGRLVNTFSDSEYTAGDIGFLVETFDESRAHVHFNTLTVRQVAASTPVAFLQDDFTDPASGWPSVSEGATLSGYHPPDYYHVQAGEPQHRSTAFYDRSFDNFTMEVEVFVDSTDTETGDFHYGLAVRRTGAAYYAFIVSPRRHTWQVFKNSPTGQEALAEGSDHSLRGLSGMDRLRVDAAGSDLVFHINGRPVAGVNDSAYSRGNIGFIVETGDETRAHVHYNTLAVRPVEMSLANVPISASPTATPTATITLVTEPTTSPGETPEATPTSAPAAPLPSSLGMVKVDAGLYSVGTGTVELAEFWIDRYEVSNAQYARFLEETDQEPPAYWESANIPATMGDHPVEGVSWDEAATYCQWVGKRLPAEAEWEAAARGPHGWLYPWGNEAGAVRLPASGTYPVGSLADNRTFFGVHDMAGNVWEWVDEPYLAVASGERVIRGGANNFQNDMVTRFPGNPASAIMVANTGIRCAATGVVVEAEEAVLFSDDFADLNSGWWQARAPVGPYFYGYHPTDFYHVQVSAPQNCLTVYREFAGTDIAVDAEIFVAATESDSGDFRYGLTLREAENRFYAFVISPRSQTWQILKNTTAGLLLMAEGSNDTIRGDSQATRDRLYISANGPEFTFFVNGALAARVRDGDYTDGNVGFFLKTVDETYAHVHYDSLVISQFAAAAGTSPAPAGSNYPVAAPTCQGYISTTDTLDNFISHTVSANETVSSIARTYGITIEDILGANGRTISDPGVIRTGQTLLIPQP